MSAGSTSSGTTPTADAPDVPKVKRGRKGAPKTRSGCKTCKKRRVKCDEARPSCMRCIGYGAQCEGYITARTNDAKGLPTRRLPRSLAPATTEGSSHHPEISSVFQRPHHSSTFSSMATRRTRASKRGTDPRYHPPLSFAQRQHSQKFEQVTAFRNQSSSLVVISPPPSIVLFHSLQEQQYFDYYKNFTVNQVSGAAQHKESFVRNCLAAIGAISKSHDCQKLGASDRNEISAQHRYFAFRQYDKAVQLIRTSISRATDIRTVLISCLLLVCFEDILGGSSRREEICAQIGHAVKLFIDWAKKQRLKGVPHFQEGLRSPNPTVIEDDLYQAFLLLDFKCMYSQDTRSFTAHMELACFGNDTILSMPAIFSNVKLAELYYSLIIRRAMHYLTAVRQASQTRPPLFMKILEEHVELSENLALEPGMRLKRIIGAGFKKYLTELHRWNAAFRPVLTAALGQKGSESFIHAMILESYAKAAILRFAGPTAEQQLSGSPLDAPRSEKVFFKPSNTPGSMQLGELDEERTANRGFAAGTETSSRPSQAEKDLPPVHIYKGVKYGYLNPLEGFGWQRGAAATWYEERSLKSGGADTDLVVLYEKRDAIGRVEIEIVSCAQPGDLGAVTPINQVRTAPPLMRF